jgi:phosphoglycerate dehydrogenase-like enzyme
MKILVAVYSQFVSWCIPDEQVARLRREFPEHTFVRATSDAEALERIVEADVALAARLTPSHLAASRRLKWIHSPAAGVGNMLFPEMLASPVVLSNSRGNSSGTIAEHVIAVTLARLLDLLPHADVVVLAAPQTSETVHLMGERELALMKRDAVLVNVSRGKLIDEPALVRALETGRLRGAALDVFEHEPLSPDSPLWSREDVLITPHVSGFHARYWDDATTLFAGNLRRFVAGEPLVNPVDKTAGY